MSQGPRRTRARLWAWAYLAVFGAEEEKEEEAVVEGEARSPAEPGADDGRTDTERT